MSSKHPSKLPKDAFEKDLFYVRPLSIVPSNSDDPWYTAVPTGRDTLHKKLNDMCFRAGVEGKKTNHSLQATSATQMYQSGVPEKVIQERTGHHSLEALRCYERTNEVQHQAVSSVLAASKPAGYAAVQMERNKFSHAVNTTNFHQESQYAPPGFSFQNLQGCTINIVNSAPPHADASSTCIDSTVTDQYDNYWHWQTDSWTHWTYPIIIIFFLILILLAV